MEEPIYLGDGSLHIDGTSFQISDAIAHLSDSTVADVIDAYYKVLDDEYTTLKELKEYELQYWEKKKKVIDITKTEGRKALKSYYRQMRIPRK